MITIILSISAVSAADIDDSSDSAIQSIEKTAIDEAVSTDAVDDIQMAENNADVLAADGDGNFTELQTSVNTGMVVMEKDYTRVEGENDISISVDVTIEGNGHKIDANNLGGIFNVNSGYTLTLIGVTLINGNAENGGAVYNNGGTLSISDSYFINNTATKSGGAIYNNGGTLDVTGSTFDGNDLTKRTTNGWGGAAIYDEGGSVLISGCTVTNNLKEIKHRGGTKTYAGDLSSAAVTSSGTLTVSDSYFANNSGCYGGAILSNENGILTVSGSRFENNLAFNGGAIDFAGQRYTITTSNFTGNSARGTGSAKSSVAYGGAICSQETSDDCIISDCRFEDNTAAYGGAISTDNSKISDCTFINNSADAKYAETFNGQSNTNGFAYGDAIYSDSSVDIADSTFTDNKGQFNTGVYVKDADITGSSFKNTPIYVDVEGSLDISDNQYDNDGSDITAWNSDIYFDGVGDVPSFDGTPYIHAEITGFAQLQAMIDELPTTGGRLMLSGDVSKLDSEYESFANGIIISKNTNIFAEGYTISANTGKVFTVNEGAALTLDKANVVGDGTSAIVNNGKVTLKVASPSTFTNVGEFAIDNRGTLSQAGMTTFTQLNDLIALVNGGEISIGMSKITKADDEKATFADGIVVEKDLTITGYASSKRVISTYLDADNSGRIFSVNDGATLTLNKIILKNGNAENGGAVYVEANNNLIANTVDFIDNVASEYDGGAIYTVGGTIALTDCVLDGNDVTKLETSASQNRGGAAIYAKDAQVTLVNTNVINNGRSELDRSKGDMVNAVINLINSNAAITGGLFENNTGIYGGAIIADGDGSQTLTVSGDTFKNNKAYNGGAIDISSMITDISDCTFDDNWVVGPGSSGYYGIGGAVATDGSGSFSLTNSNFTGNRATGLNASAGAVSAGLDQGCHATIDGCVFKENTAELKGGAVFIAGYDDDATISNCNFSDDNTAEIGGSLYNGGNLKLTNNVIEGDSGIYSSGAGKIDTHAWVIVNDNQDITVDYYDTIDIVLKITDDNGNIIRINEPTITIDMGSYANRKTLTLDEETGFYTLEGYIIEQSGLLTPSRTTLGKYFSYNANTNLNSSYVTMIKATPTVEVVYENVTDLDDVVININVIGKEGAPKISWAATAATPFKIVVNNETYKVKISNGVGSVTIPNLPAGNYVINASWDGNTKYNGIEPQLYNLLVTPLKGTYTDLQAQIDAADGVLDLAYNFTYNADIDGANFINGIVIDKDIQIDGKGYTICGSDATRIFNVSGAELLLNNVTLCHGAADEGAGVYVGSGAQLYADYVVFENNVALDNGGAIYTDGGEIYIHDSVLDSNDVANLETSVYQNMGGAAIYAKNTFIGLFNTNVTNNGRSDLDRSKGDMINAVINLINSNGAITGGLFENNTGIYGGAIIADGDGSQTLTVSGATFKNNKAYNGGAIDISSMITDISDCTFDNNWVVGPGSTGYYGIGGAVATDGSGSFSLTDSNFTGNRATGLNASAGAVSVGLDQGCHATIDGCVFKENTAELKGGAVFIAGYDDDATVSNCNFSDDNAAEIGGSLYNGGNLKLTGNTVEGDASGIYSSSAGKIDTHVWVIVNDNQDVTVEYYDTIPIVVKITDDNGNLIRIDEPTLTIDLGDSWTRYTLTLDEATGFYTMDNYLVNQKSGLLTPSRTTIGKYFASYNANTNLNSSYITMIKADASLEVTYQNVSRPDDVVITINLTGKQGAPKISWAATSATPFKVTVNDVEYKVKITNGIGTLTIPDLPAGEYVVNASWDGNTKYNPIEPTTFILKVSNLNVTEFTVNTKGKFLSDENVTINVTLLGVNGEGLNETFNVIVNNAEYTVTVSNGTGSFNVSGLAPGHYSALGIFPGNDNYNGAYATGLFTVLYPLPILNVTVEDITYGEDAVINITLTEADGTPLDGRIGLSVGGIFSLDTTILGFASIKVPNLPANENGWAITVYYLPDEEHINTMNDTEIVKVAKAASTIDLTGPDDINIGENAEFTATIGAKSDVFVLNIWVDGKEYILMGPAEWDSNVASFMITPEWLPEARDYNITVQFKGNENYTASENISQILTVNKIDAGNVIQISGSTVIYGENATVTVELPMDAEGNVTVTIPGVGTFNETVEGGIAVVEIPGLGAGLYELFAVEYSGDNRYTSHTGMATVEVKKAKSSVEIKPIAEVTYGNNVTIGYTVLNATTIKINVAYGGLVPVYYVTFDANVSKYDGSLVLPNLAAGEYFVVVENDVNDNYTFSAAPAEFTINKAEPTMQTEISPNIKAGDANVVVQVVLPENATGKVMLLIDGEPTNQMGYDLINGTVNITVPADFVNAGKRSYYVIYDGDNNYTSAYDLKSFEVSKADPMVFIAVIPDINNKEPAAVSIFVGNITGGLTVARATGQILIEGYGVARLENLEDGISNLNLTDIVPGDYEIKVTYLGDDNFNNATNSTKFTVPKRAATVELTNVTANILGGQNATFTVNMNPDSANGNVTIYIDGTEYATVVLDDEYANATVSIPDLGEGEHKIGVKYNGNDHYNASEVVNTTVTVDKAGSKVTIDPITNVTFGHTVEISYTVENETTVTYSVVNESGVKQTYQIKDGKLVLSGLSVGNYTVTITNAENNMFTGDSATAKFTVSENPTFDFNVNFPENSTDTVFSISVPEDAGGYLLVDIDGQHYYAPVKNGTATVVVPGLAPGNYTATVSYTGDDKYVNATTTKEVSIPSNLPEDALAIPESGDTETPSTYSISLPADADGFLIVDVDGTKYVAALQNGSASVTVPALSEGEHNVTVTYTGDGKYSSASKSSNFTVKKPVYKITSNKNVNVIYSSNAYYKVLVTRDGKAVGAGEKVTVKYNGKTYTVTTDKNGYATLKLDTKVKVKKYAITASYKGVTVKNTVNVKHLIKAKYIKVKKSKVNKIKVKTNKVNGKFLKGKKLTLKVNGKKIKAKINKKGVATFKIKKYVLKNLKAGKKYKYSISYGKDKITKRMKVKK